MEKGKRRLTARELLLKFSKARLIKQFSAIETMTEDGKRRPRPTGVVLRLLCGKQYRYWSDGSLRHADRSHAAPGKAGLKAAKRLRRYDREGRRVA